MNYGEFKEWVRGTWPKAQWDCGQGYNSPYPAATECYWAKVDLVDQGAVVEIEYDEANTLPASFVLEVRGKSGAQVRINAYSGCLQSSLEDTYAALGELLGKGGSQ